MVLHGTKMLLQSKGNGHQIEEAPTEWEKNFVICTFDEINNQNI
jgi:hypothetical protein